MNRLTVIGALVVAATVPIHAEGTAASSVEELVKQLAPLAHAPGKKDTLDNFDSFRLGFALTDTGEGSGGYSGAIEQLRSAELEGQPSPGYSLFENLDPPFFFPTTPVVPDVVDHLFPLVFDQSYSRFSTGGVDNDLDAVLETPGMGLLSTRNTIFSPQRVFDEFGVDSIVAFDFPSLTDVIAPAALAAGVKVTQSIGFANDFLFPVGEFDYNLAHPVVTRFASTPDEQNLLGFGELQPQYSFLTTYTLDDVDGTPGVLDDGMLFFMLNMLDPGVAALLKDSLTERVNALPDEVVDYHTISGEFFTYFSNPIDCTFGVHGGNYTECLREMDYSDASMVHFRHWMGLRYDSLAEIESAWAIAGSLSEEPYLCVDVESCTALDPLAAADYATDLQGVHDDWRAFQDQQFHLDAYGFQYRAAKQARPTQAMYTFRKTPIGVDRGARYSDGVALGSAYVDNDARLSMPTPVKRLALHGVSWGESVNFPQLEMPKPVGVTFCWAEGEDPSWPDEFRPTCWDEDFANRTLREMLVLGVDSVGLGYFEGSGGLNIQDGTFGASGTNMVAAMAGEVEQLQTRRSFMTPWRSPLMVHTGSTAETGVPATLDDVYGAESGPVSEVIRVLAEQQVQHGLFSLLEGLDDLWLPSRRDVLMSAFVPEMDIELLNTYRSRASEEGWHLAVLTEFSTALEMLADPSFQICTVDIRVPGILAAVDLADLDAEVGCGTSLTHRVFAFESTEPEDIETVMELRVLPMLESVSSTPLVPVRAVETSGASLEDIDVTVSTDGLNFLVTAANTSDNPRTFRLQVETPTGGPVLGYTFPNGNMLTLRPGEAEVRFVQATVDGLDTFVTSGELAGAVGLVPAKLDALAALGYDVLAGRAANDRLQEIDASSESEKALAGLVRLQRMSFVRYDSNDDSVSVVDLEGRGIEGARVQLEFVLQDRSLREQALTNENGDLTVVANQPQDVTVWDLTTQQYGIPGVSFIEVNAYDPEFGTQSTTLAQSVATGD